jgi:hypothetical protein
MLPGFNHNIRYQDRVFHVQTEDNGLAQPFLVTQVFIGGHLVAIEKSSYRAVLEKQLDQDARNEQIRSLMQDQHKRLLRNLVNHAYDDKIALYFGHGAGKTDQDTIPQPRVPTGDLALAAVVLPVADDIPDQPRSPTSGRVAPLTPPPKLIEDLTPVPAVDGIPPPAELPPVAAKPSDEAIDDDELFRVFDEELQRQVPWSPTQPRGSLPPLDPKIFGKASDPLPESPTVEKKVEQTIPVFKDKTSSDKSVRPKQKSIDRPERRSLPPEATTEVNAKKTPPVADTLVDFGLPAALKEQLGQAKAALEATRSKLGAQPAKELKSDPKIARFRMPRAPSPTPQKTVERETQIDLGLRRRASSSRSKPPTSDPSKADTLMDVDAAELKTYLEKRRAEQAAAKTKRQAAESWGDQVDTPNPEDSKRPNILVVERSLDEVILSYLSDED